MIPVPVLTGIALRTAVPRAANAVIPMPLLSFKVVRGPDPEKAETPAPVLRNGIDLTPEPTKDVMPMPVLIRRAVLDPDPVKSETPEPDLL